MNNARFTPGTPARAPISGASLPATKADGADGKQTLIPFTAFEAGGGCWVLAYALQPVAWPPTRQVSRCSIRFARLELERMTPFTPAC